MRLQQRQFDFNKVNDELRALKGITHLDGRFINMASKYWWAYRIALEFHLNPHEVKKWSADEVMETLAAIGMVEKAQKQTAKKG